MVPKSHDKLATEMHAALDLMQASMAIAEKYELSRDKQMESLVRCAFALVKNTSQLSLLAQVIKELVVRTSDAHTTEK